MELAPGAEHAHRSAGGRLLQRVGGSFLHLIDTAVEHRWPAALERAARTEHLPTDERIRLLRREIRIELAATGALAGGTATLPNPVSWSAVGVDSAVLTVRLIDLILTIGVIHGHDEASVEDRRMWVLAVLVAGNGAMELTEQVAKQMGIGLGTTATRAVPAELVRAINRKLGRTVVTKWGTKRGVLVLGKLLPAGIGAAVGAGGNAATVTVVARHADRYLGLLPRTTAQSADRR